MLWATGVSEQLGHLVIHRLCMQIPANDLVASVEREAKGMAATGWPSVKSILLAALLLASAAAAEAVRSWRFRAPQEECLHAKLSHKT